MDGFELFAKRRYEKGFADGLAKGICLGENKKEKELVNNLANNLIINSGNKLTKEEALKQARELFKPLPHS